LPCTGIGGADAKKGKVKEGKGMRKGGPEVPPGSPRPEPVDAANPLVEVMVEEEEGGRLMMPGNMVLVHLTLACECLYTHTRCSRCSMKVCGMYFTICVLQTILFQK